MAKTMKVEGKKIQLTAKTWRCRPNGFQVKVDGDLYIAHLRINEEAAAFAKIAEDLKAGIVENIVKANKIGQLTHSIENGESSVAFSKTMIAENSDDTGCWRKSMAHYEAELITWKKQLADLQK